MAFPKQLSISEIAKPGSRISGKRRRPAANNGCRRKKPIHRGATLINEGLYPYFGAVSEVHEFPMVAPSSARPRKIVPFSACLGITPAPDVFVHFYEDDCKFIEVWDQPEIYSELFAGFGGIIMPDFSLCSDYTVADKITNFNCSCKLAAFYQAQGIEVIPNLVWQQGCDWLLEPFQKGGTIAVCGRGHFKDRDDRRRFLRNFRVIIDRLHPELIVYYGPTSHGILDYPQELGIEVSVHEPLGLGQLDWEHRNGQR